MRSIVTTLFVAVLAGLCLCGTAHAQDFPKPGPEQAILKQYEGAWDATVNFMSSESKGSMVFKMDLGGLWLFSEFKGKYEGTEFTGRGVEGYDPRKKKYVSGWVDSMSTSLMTSEGTYDAATKTFTYVGDSFDPMKNKVVKHRMTSEIKDKDTILFKMFMDDAKEPTMTINYRRRK